jgi:hypothetical protein
MHHGNASSPVGAVAIIALLALVVGFLLVGLVRRQWRWPLLAGVAAGAVFQLGHFGEHVAQAGYWAGHTEEAPWMTPWASALARSVGGLVPGTPTFGMEALHLVGNAIFLTGVVAIYVAVLRDGSAFSQRPARAGVAVQSVHVLEHVALTLSVLVGGRARGISTGFGLLVPGPGLWTYRVWWHLTINAIATALLAAAVVRSRRGTAPDASMNPAYAG